MTDILKVDPDHPGQEIIQKAAHAVRKGGVVVFPTTGLYGLAADAMNPVAVDRIFSMKGRVPDKPISVLVKDRKSLLQVVRNIPDIAVPLLDRFWPGGITFVLEATTDLPANLTAGTGKIGVRIPVHQVATALVAKTGGPITATSANVSGRSGCSDIGFLDGEIAQKADLVLDAGLLAGGPGSSVVDVTVTPPLILREGAVPAASLIAACPMEFSARKS